MASGAAAYVWKRGHLKGPGPATKVVSKRAAKTGHKSEKRGGPVAYIEEVIDDGFFRVPKTLAAAKAALGNRAIIYRSRLRVAQCNAFGSNVNFGGRSLPRIKVLRSV